MNNPNPGSNPYAAPTAAVSDIEASGAVEPAGRGTRLGAYLLDTLIVLLFVYVPFFALGGTGYFQQMMAAQAQDGQIADPSGYMAAFAGLAVGAIAWIIITIILVVRNRQTIGKKILGIKVTRADSSTVSIGRLFWLRNFVPGLLMAIPLIGYVVLLVDALMIFGEKRQCLHDRIADTIVIKA